MPKQALHRLDQPVDLRGSGLGDRLGRRADEGIRSIGGVEVDVEGEVVFLGQRAEHALYERGFADAPFGVDEEPLGIGGRAGQVVQLLRPITEGLGPTAPP